MAHEDLGHVSKQQALGSGIGIGAVILDQIIPGAGRVAPIAGALIQRTYSRPEEYEADKHGVELLQRVGREKNVMISTLTWLMNTSGPGGGRLLQHPSRHGRPDRTPPQAVSPPSLRALRAGVTAVALLVLGSACTTSPASP